MQYGEFISQSIVASFGANSLFEVSANEIQSCRDNAIVFSVKPSSFYKEYSKGSVTKVLALGRMES